MSIRVMTSVWEHSKAAGTDLLVLLALADIADDNGECWPSMSTIGRKCRVDTRTARRRIRSLEEIGEVVVIIGAGKSSTAGGTRSNRYRITVHIQPDTGDLPYPDTLPVQGTGVRDGRARVSGGGRAQVSAYTSYRSVNDTSLVPTSPKPAKKRSTVIPEDFEVTHEMRQWCESQNIRSDPMTETEKFIDHHRSKGNTFADPISAWRNWMRNADKFSRSTAADNRSKSMQTVDAVLGAVTSRQEMAQ